LKNDKDTENKLLTFNLHLGSTDGAFIHMWGGARSEISSDELHATHYACRSAFPMCANTDEDYNHCQYQDDGDVV
jgi:hypothetical protein